MNKTTTKLFLFYGPNSVGKTTLARALATKHKALHIQIDWFSSMHRGRKWHTRSNNKDKINLLLGALTAAIKETNYRLFFVDGVLIYQFMFKMIENWCKQNKVKLILIKLVGNQDKLKYRTNKRKKEKNNWNKMLPDIYKNLTYKNTKIINTTSKSLNHIINLIDKNI